MTLMNFSTGINSGGVESHSGSLKSKTSIFPVKDRLCQAECDSAGTRQPLQVQPLCAFTVALSHLLPACHPICK